MLRETKAYCQGKKDEKKKRVEAERRLMQSHGEMQRDSSIRRLQALVRGSEVARPTDHRPLWLSTELAGAVSIEVRFCTSSSDRL